MDRLTEEIKIGPFASLKDKSESRPGAFGDYDCLFSHMIAVTRLKEYEDTGLSPEEVVAMKNTLDEYHKVADPLLRAKCGAARL
ncbi:MAG: hypothetical protein IJ955_10250 [Oscillospiraceae bacterium]|nr:hypothetical protein [Oscillospiraceae bacterium]